MYTLVLVITSIIVSNQPQNTIASSSIYVWRIQNDSGNGHFTDGGVKYIPESYFKSTVPTERAGFHPLVYKLLVQGYAKSGCLNKDELIKLINPEAINKLEDYGFKLISIKAS